MNLESDIRKLFLETLHSQGGELKAPLEPNSVLLESGLDSLGFAILVSRLEMEFGYDPFLLESEPIYPRTYAEFVGLYEKHAAHRKNG